MITNIVLKFIIHFPKEMDSGEVYADYVKKMFELLNLIPNSERIIFVDIDEKGTKKINNDDLTSILLKKKAQYYTHMDDAKEHKDTGIRTRWSEGKKKLSMHLILIKENYPLWNNELLKILDKVELTFHKYTNALGNVKVNNTKKDIGHNYPKISPPRECNSNTVTDGSSSIFFSYTDYTLPERYPEYYGIIESIELPKSVSRQVTKEGIQITFSENLEDEVRFIKDIQYGYYWLGKVLNFPIKKGYNYMGDYKQKITTHMGDTVVFFDIAAIDEFNNNKWHIYKNINLIDDKTIPTIIAEKLKQYSQTLTISSTSNPPREVSCESINVMLPTRQEALAILEEAKKIGINKVAYRDTNPDYFWIINPNGNWLSQADFEDLIEEYEGDV